MNVAMTPLHITSQFDAGAIEVLSLLDHRNIEVNIRPDNAAELAQWFYFALHGAAGLQFRSAALRCGTLVAGQFFRRLGDR